MVTNPLTREMDVKMANTYVDTRGNVTSLTHFTDAVVAGIAPGGGLYVPSEIPHFTLEQITNMADMPYARRAATIYKAFGVDLPDETIDTLMDQAYGDNFDDKDICPIVNMGDDTYVLELFHGPTSAFKDMALQCLPLYFSASVDKLMNEGKLENDFLILVATSGDTGKAALEGFKNRDHVSIIVFYPHGGVSDIQYKQMSTQTGDNVAVYSAQGNFDDCQTSVKQAFGDKSFATKLADENNLALSSANSINWGRLLPQVVYYVSTYAKLVESGDIEAGAPMDVCIPTGNFGNILAAYYARELGTPIEHLYCASNENNVLTDFINTGTYDISAREFHLTPSPSMDILVSSNLERQLFELTGRDSKKVSGWMADLARDKKFTVDAETFAKVRALYSADFASAQDCFDTIKSTFEEHNYLMDPHTAVAYTVAQRLRGENPVVVASTAHWGKFGDNVLRALSDMKPGEALPENLSSLSGVELNRKIAELTGIHTIPANLDNLDDAEIRFSKVIDGNLAGIEGAVSDWLA